ncbi:hypothetical protein RR46_07318 [Papilio xuthus]|uniref:Uncharacterized protein n=1 Tax=Papilio xuthus TaxID=66420 RepID=A0A194PW15_PAPXU|nr:hypothetical protein RR46_07318 [Papilio xuthus]
MHIEHTNICCPDINTARRNEIEVLLRSTVTAEIHVMFIAAPRKRLMNEEVRSSWAIQFSNIARLSAVCGGTEEILRREGREARVCVGLECGRSKAPA